MQAYAEYGAMQVTLYEDIARHASPRARLPVLVTDGIDVAQPDPC
jgi:alpha-D-ribose 1-methylphosphonate 5-phosphate C-P lyase